MGKKKKKKKKVLLEEINPVLSRYHGKPSDLKPVLQYGSEYWVQRKYRKERVELVNYIISNRGTFLTGFLPRVTSFLKQKKIKYRLQQPNYDIAIKEPIVPGIDFRDYQDFAVGEMIKARRGVWKAPTQAGKTIIVVGLISGIQTPALVICPTKDIFNQNYETLTKYFGTKRYKIGRIGGGHKDPREITVAIINSLVKMDKYGLKWGLCIVDEAHRCSKLKGKFYAKALSELMCPFRYGITATPPDPEEAEEEQMMAMEGHIGPIIGVTEYEEIKEYLAKPILKLRRVPPNKDMIRKAGKYVDLYHKGIVMNRARNQLIMQEAVRWVEEKMTVLILVERIRHGEELMKFAKIVSPKTFVFLHGKTKDAIREEEKKFFKQKKRKAVIATRIWAEGSSIPSLDVLINAVGGESEKATIQRFGRGMAKTKKKSEVILVDFIDANTHRWFEKHSLRRICAYSEAGWL